MFRFRAGGENAFLMLNFGSKNPLSRPEKNRGLKIIHTSAGRVAEIDETNRAGSTQVEHTRRKTEI